MSELGRLTFIVIAGIATIGLLTIFIPQMLGITPEWGGADDAASEIIENTGYEPWFSPIWEPPSGEIESLLFALQAAIGAGIIGYIAGLYRGRQEKNREVEACTQPSTTSHTRTD